MKRIFVPTQSPKDWKRLLAKPDLHWREGYSAMTLARAWESAHPFVPPEIASCLESSGAWELSGLELLLAIPEYQASLPGGRRPSQTDVLALMRGPTGIVAVAVEGKVDETFGPAVGDKRTEDSAGVTERLMWLSELFGLQSVPDEIRYQLLHRSASAVLVAREFDATAAVMLVHSFSPTGLWFDDFDAFAALFGVAVAVGSTSLLGDFGGKRLYVGWCKGDQRFRVKV